MNQLELNKSLAKAYGIQADRLEITCEKNELGNIYTHKMIPINEDLYTLFLLCIEYSLSICHFEITKEVVIGGLHDSLINEFYENYSSKQEATCAAMFKALCVIKNIDLK